MSNSFGNIFACMHTAPLHAWNATMNSVFAIATTRSVVDAAEHSARHASMILHGSST